MPQLSAYCSASVAELKKLGAESQSEVSTAAAQTVGSTVGELSVAFEAAELVAYLRLTLIAVATFGSGQKDLPERIENEGLSGEKEGDANTPKTINGEFSCHLLLLNLVQEQLLLLKHHLQIRLATTIGIQWSQNLGNRLRLHDCSLLCLLLRGVNVSLRSLGRCQTNRLRNGSSGRQRST